MCLFFLLPGLYLFIRYIHNIDLGFYGEFRLNNNIRKEKEKSFTLIATVFQFNSVLELKLVFVIVNTQFNNIPT